LLIVGLDTAPSGEHRHSTNEYYLNKNAVVTWHHGVKRKRQYLIFGQQARE
jgi:hypothetical protein